MIGGISRGLTNTATYNRKGESVQTNASGYQKCLLDAATNYNYSLNEKVRKEKKNSLSLVGTNVPDTVQEAWDKAEKEAGVNGAALEADGKLSQITQLFSMSLVRFHNEGNRDVLGGTVDSARAAVRKAMELLGIPQTEAEKKEKLFYEAFLRYL